MAERRIDALARSLAAGLPRRRLLGGITAGLLSSPLGNRPRDAAAGGCKKPGKKCDKNKDCCDGAKCTGGECRCKSGREECAGKCFKLNTDEQHCGDCGTECGAAETCCGGTCVDLRTDSANCGGCGTACSETEACRFGGVCASCFPQTACGGVCVDLTADPDNCGECGTECEGINEICGNGFCRDCDLLAGERPCLSVCCVGGRACIDGECELA